MRMLFTFALTATLACGASARADDLSSGPITIVVGFAAGGPSDTIARIVAESMRRSLNQPLIIENVAGAGGALGIARVARATPDGRTIGVGNWSSHVGAPAANPGPFDVLTDLEPLSPLPIAPLMIVGKKALPPNDMRELVTWLKANPDKVSAGIVGIGSASHVSSIYFQKRTDTHFQFVPYRGGALAVQDLVAGQIDLRFGTEASTVVPYLRSGQIKPYAMLTETRWRAAPEIPTIEEAGFPGLSISLWHGLWAPKHTPSDVIARLAAAVAVALADPMVQKRIADLGMDIPPPERLNPQGLRAHHKAEIDKWWPIIKAAGITAK
jgi:tripartite-type tricarboxylate transporter receptor subunit TctC